MKKSFLLATLFYYASFSVFAQPDHGSHQRQTTNSNKEAGTDAAGNDASSQQKLSQLLSVYYNIKDALVMGSPDELFNIPDNI